MRPLVASARMYGVAPEAVAGWASLFAEISTRADVALEVVAHAFPATLDDLWQRPDLGCAFMCGWPLALEDTARTAAGTALRPIIAAPVPAAAWSAGQPVYRSDFVVAASSQARTVEDMFGQLFAFNALSSHSGVNMPRAFLSRFASRAPLFAERVGPLTTPRRCIEAVLDGRADITAVDSFALQLLCHHDAAIAGAIRIVGSGDPSPIPPLVGGPALPEPDRIRLCAALVGLAGDEKGRGLLAALCLAGFAPADHATYRRTLSVQETARNNAYPDLI